MKTNVILTFMLFLATFLGVFAQRTNEVRSYCYTDEMYERSLERDATLKEKMDERDNAINNYRENILSNPLNRAPSSSSVVNLVIPVVVYVVHDFGPENISDQQVIGQIDKLNDEFIGHGIQFCLATTEGITPLPGSSPNPGIIRIQDGLTNHLTSNEIGLKNLSTLSGNQYLRIWVVKDIDNGSGTLGYARPKTPWATTMDGIVMRYDAFGDVATCGCTNLLPSNNQGKVVVHEVGHYLGLFHTFQGGCTGMTAANCDVEGDRVCDTPPVAIANYGCPTPGSINSCTETPDSPDLLDNHMDYTNDMCRTSFTNGQGTRMISMINLYYLNLVSSSNLVYTGVQCNGGLLAVFSSDNNTPCNNTVVTYTANTVSGATYTWNFGDGSPIVSGNPITHSYTTGETFFPVTLTINDGTNTASETQQIYVSDCSPISSSQGNWYFYKNGGLDFSSGSPVADDAGWVNNTMTGPVNSTIKGEASAVQSNNNGDLLFYTDGVLIWDENHTQINSGNELTGFQTSAYGAMIVPSPANSNEYYIFTSSTISGFNHPNTNKGLRYSKVQVTGTSASLTASVNVPVPAPSGFVTGDNGAIYVNEGISAIASCEGYWILCNGTIGNDKYIVVYELTSSGISYHSHYLSSVTSNYTILEASPDGSKIAISRTSGVPANNYLYDFDKFTGVVSGEILLEMNSPCMGLSFSPNSQLLYRANGTGIYQYDIMAANPVATQVASGVYRGHLQIGPNQKIYGVTPDVTKLFVIHQPNVLATSGNTNACMFSENGPALNTVASGMAIIGEFGLPNMIDANTRSVFSNTISYTFTNCFTHEITSSICASTYIWDFGDPASGAANTSTLQNPTHVFSGPGTYTVTVNAGGSTITEIIDVGLNLNFSGPTEVCLDNTTIGNYSVAGGSSGATYSWSATGGTLLGLNGFDNIDVNWTSLPGSVTVTVTDPSTDCVESFTYSVIEDCSCLEAITYQAGQHTTVISGDLVKTSGGSSWTNLGVGRGQSNQEISSGEYIEWEITGTTYNEQKGLMLGLSYSIPVTSTYTTVDYGLYFLAGYYQMYENGTGILPLGGFIYAQAGDIMRIERNNCDGDKIVYRVNGVEIGSTVDPNPTSVMKVEIAMGHQGNTVHNLTKDCLINCPCSEDISYQAGQHTTIVSGDLVKTSGGSSWTNSGVGRGQSVETVSSGEYIEWEITGTSFNDQRGIMLGLSHTIPTSSTYYTVDYALYFYDYYQMFENGTGILPSGGFIYPQAGDIVRIERNNCNGDKIIYKINGIEVRSTVDPNPALVMKVEIALGYQGNRVHNLIKDCIPECPCLEPITYQTGQNTSIVSGELVKTSGGNGWANVGRGQSVEIVSSGEYIEWEVTGTSFNDQKGLMLGLSYSIPTSSSYNTVDHALYFYHKYYVYENGTPIPLIGGTVYPQVGDIIRIERNDCNGNNIVYKINDVEVGSTVDLNPVSDMKVEIAMGYQGNTTNNLIKGCFADCDLVPAWTSNVVSNFTFSLSGSNNGSTCSSLQYNWAIFNSSGTLVTSFTGQNPPNVQLFMTDVYQVCLTINQLDVNGSIMCSESTCGDLPADFTIANPRLNENQSSNLPENIDLVKVIAVPNPSTNQVSFILENNDLDERNGELTLYDIQGKMIIQQQISLSEGYKVDVSSLASGMYYYKVTISGRESEIDKLVIQNH